MAEQLQDDIDDFFQSIDTAAASSQALGQDIPLLGAGLSTIEPTVPVLFKHAQDKIHTALSSLAAGATATQIADALNDAGVTGLSAAVTGPDDHQVVAIAFQATDTETVSKDGAKLDVGVPVLGLDATADFSGTLTSKLNTTLDYDVVQNTLTLGDAGTKDLDIGLGVAVTAAATGSLGPLSIDIATNTAAPAPPQITLDISADLANAGGGPTVTDFATTGTVNLDLGIKTSLDETLLPTVAADLKIGYALGGAEPSQPSVALDDITVDLGGLVDELAQTIAPITKLFSETPFKQILEGLLGPVPILNDAAHLLPFLEKLLDTVPDGGDGTISALDLAGVYFETQDDTADLTALQAFASALAIVKQLTSFLNAGDPGAAGLGKINLGSIQLVGNTSNPVPPPAAPAAPGGVAPDAINPAQAAPTVTFTDPATDPAAAANQLAAPLFGGSVAYKGATSDGPTALSTGLVDPAGDPPGTAGVPGLSIPLLDDPSGAEIESILLPALFPNQPPATLISYTIPTLSFSVPVPPTGMLFLPIVGPFGLTLGGMFGGSLGFTVGYNTAGLADGNLADGLYLSASQSDIASISGEVDAGLGVDLGIVQASIDGGIKATVGAALGEPEVPLSTFTSYIDPTGRLAAEVNVVLTIGFGPFSFTVSDNIADITIVDFSAGEAAGTIDQAAALADYQTGGGGNDIVLNAGDRAGDREVDPHDDDESFRISNSAVDVNGDPTTDTLDVSALGVEDLFGAPGQPIQAVTGDLGGGDNTLTVDPDVTQAVSVTAGDGNNTFTPGGGIAVFSAGSGDNNFYGGSAQSYFIAGPGSDFFHPGAGPVEIEGSIDGHNQVTYEASPSAVTLTPSASGPGLFGTGGYAQGDTLSNVQYIIGSSFDDILVAEPTVGSTLDGGPGNDVLIGGAADDFLIGGPGADYIDGGGGENGTSYITSTAGVDVDLATGFAYGGEATGDVLRNIQDVQGSIFDDVLTGTPGLNRIDGGRGDDTINGDGGADYLAGGDGNDTIYGSGDGDMLDGGSGDNTLTYADYTPVDGVGVTVNLAAGRGGGTDLLGTIATDGTGGFTPQADTYSNFQTLVGSSGDDILMGDSNDDTIEGGAGDDTLLTGAGPATLIGGAGADTLIGLTATDPDNTALVGGGGTATADYSDGYGVTVDLTTGIGQRSTAEGDRLYGVSNLIGSPGADVLTGDDGNNIIDPGLSGGGIDMVDGGGGDDTLVLDYSQGDYGQGVIGGIGHAPADGSDPITGAYGQGSLQRMDAAGTSLLDGVDFTDITKLDVTGTASDDTIYGSGNGDRISTGAGDDMIYEAAGGPANIDAGDGDDTVYYGTLLSSTPADGPFFLDGGAGIDTLSISLRGDASAQTGNVSLAGSVPGTEFVGTNLTLPDGSAVVDFETLKNVTTGNANDTVIQPGNVNNVISTGFGQDVIAPGLGTDLINGGYDFTPGIEISAAQTDGKTGATYYNIINMPAFLENGGDQLDLDYSSYAGPDGVVGTTSTVRSTIDARDSQGYDFSFGTNDGHYTAGSNTDNFAEIERLDVVGSSQNDVLVGTADGFNDLPHSEQYDSLDSQRGDDVLQGGDGNDILIGLSGSDVLDGGAGDDLLIGGEHDVGDGYDVQEIDTLTGGPGADTFVLGTSDGSFYADFNRNGPTPLATTTRAIITDFTPADGDKIELYDKASDYVAVQNGADTLIYENFGSTDPQDLNLVAQVENFSGFDVHASYVTYDPQLKSETVDVNGNPVSQATVDLRDAESGTAIQPLPTAQSGPSAAHAHLVADDRQTTGAAPESTTPAFTVTQDSNPQDLEAALVADAAAAGIDPDSQSIKLSGNAAAFGTFSDDPFGLGSGIVLSTGKVTDIVGPNTDSSSASNGGSRSAPLSKTLDFVNIGTVITGTAYDQGFSFPLNDVVYRADLTNFGGDLGSLVLTDGNTGATDEGGGGVASGFDLDGIVLSHTLVSSVSGTAANTLNNASFLAKINAFDFSAADLRFTPGTEKPADANYPVGSDLLGSINGLVDNSVATLQTFDGGVTTGALSLGDGGSLGLNLTQPVSTQGPLYLYIAEAASGGTGAGEAIDGTVAASSQPLPTSGPLSTDFGPPGAAGDTTSLTYTFATAPGSDADTAFFTFALFTQDLPTLAGSPVNDQFKITLNGVNLAHLSDGSAATINNLEHSPEGPTSPDLILNTDESAPAHDITAVNAYTTPLTFAGALNPAGQTNTLVVQVADAGDGLLDSGILIKAGTFKAGAGPGGLTIENPSAPLVVGDPPVTIHVTLDPGSTPPTAPVMIVLTPNDPSLDFGNGAGQATTVTINPGDPYTVDVPISAVDTGVPEGGETITGSVTVTSPDPRFGGASVAPIVVTVASDTPPPVAYHWATAISGDFTTAADWNPTRVPTIAADALVDAAGAAYTVTVSSADAAAALTTVAAATVAVVDTAGAAGQLSVAESIVNAGTIALDSVGDATALILGSQDSRAVKLTGGGKVTLSDSAQNIIETTAASPATALENVDNTITGAGEIDGSNGLALLNDAGGTIDATGADHGLLIGTVSLTNKGVLEDTGAGGLQVASAAVANTGGTISAAGAGAHVDLENTAIRGGALETSGGGLIDVVGTVTLEDSTAADAITVAGDVAGAGTLAVEDGTTIFAAGAALSAAALSVAAGATVDIAGTLSYTGQLANAGTLFVDPGAELDLAGQVSGSGGQLDIYGDGTLVLDQPVGPSQTVAFSGRGGELGLGSPGTFQAPITGFAAGDALDLQGETVLAVSYSGSTLSATLADSTTQTFDLTGSVTSFTTKSDGAGGSLIVAAGIGRLPYVDSITSDTPSVYGAPPPAIVTFAVTFSKLAIGFDASNIQLSGLPGAALTGITTTDDTTYQVSVSTGTATGDLQIKIIGAGTGYFPPVPVIQYGSLGSGGSAFDVATASLAGPGSSDLVATDDGGSNLNVLAQNADGTVTGLGTYSTIPAGGAVFSHPQGIAVGDFNGDGKPDIAVANSGISYPSYFGTTESTNGDIAILLGNGDGTLQPSTFVSVGSNEYPTQIAQGDFNGDGKPDLVTANYNLPGAPSDTISVVYGLGDGSFTAPSIYSLAETPEFVAVGDLTGQGHSDTVISTDEGVAIALDGNFLSPTYLDIGQSTGRAAIGDLNGDGKADLVVPTQAGLAILLGNGDGTFSAPIFTAPPPVGTFSAPVISDVTGDGIPDVVASLGDGFDVLIGNGDGTFDPGVFRFSSDPYDSSYGLAVSDVNGDGAPDIILPVNNNFADQQTAPIDTFLNSDGPTDSYEIDRTPATSYLYAYAQSGPGAYRDIGAGQDLRITVAVSKPFTTSAPIVLQLDNGATVQGTMASYGNSLVFDYVPQANDGEDIADLTVTGLAASSGTITDPFGNDVAVSGDTQYQVDTTAPTVVSIAQSDPAVTDASTVDYVVTFSETVSLTEAMIGVDPASTVSGASIASVTATSPLDDFGGATTYDVSVDTGTGGGTLQIEFIPGITDPAGNPLATPPAVPAYTIESTPCYCPGTLILTERGEVAVERLAVGDRVLTASGASEPIRWIGRRSYGGAFIAGNHLMLPVCIRKGALAAGKPHADLWVSPGHALFIDGQLVPAWRLVNGVSVVQAQAVAEVTYIHAELARHDILVANGAAAESFLDDGCRGQFHNAADSQARDAAPMVPFAARLEDGFGLQRAQERVAARAGVCVPPEPAGPLRGFIDVAGPGRVSGWAQDAENPEEPVTLTVRMGAQPVLSLLANGYRADLRQAGLGSGCHAFAIDLPDWVDGPVSVHRTADGASLAATEAAVAAGLMAA